MPEAAAESEGRGEGDSGAEGDGDCEGECVGDAVAPADGVEEGGAEGVAEGRGLPLPVAEPPLGVPLATPPLAVAPPLLLCEGERLRVPEPLREGVAQPVPPPPREGVALPPLGVGEPRGEPLPLAEGVEDAEAQGLREAASPLGDGVGVAGGLAEAPAAEALPLAVPHRPL